MLIYPEHSEDGENSTHDNSYRTHEIDEVTKQEADQRLASFFFRTGISFRLADSESFKAFVAKINPSYAESMPSAKMVSGTLLDQDYEKETNKLNVILESSNNLTLISDGWTNVR